MLLYFWMWGQAFLSQLQCPGGSVLSHSIPEFWSLPTQTVCSTAYMMVSKKIASASPNGTYVDKSSAWKWSHLHILHVHLLALSAVETGLWGKFTQKSGNEGRSKGSIIKPAVELKSWREVTSTLQCAPGFLLLFLPSSPFLPFRNSPHLPDQTEGRQMTAGCMAGVRPVMFNMWRIMEMETYFGFLLLVGSSALS